MRKPIGLLCVAMLLLSAPSARLWACAVAGQSPTSGSPSPVQVVAESAVIVWDAATHTEHFIRRATFDSKARDFGFLVPTPSTPELKTTPDTAFTLLEQTLEPETRYEERTGFNYTPLFLRALGFSRQDPPDGVTEAMPGAVKMRSLSMSAGASATPPVRVLKTARLANFDATVLEADNPVALADWLRTHGYASRPALTAWLAPYVQAKWKITAFKIVPISPSMQHEGSKRRHDEYDGDSSRIESPAVRMSFHTDRPFFPYREPADQPAMVGPEGSRARTLRVYLLGGERMAGVVGTGATAPAWNAPTKWADALDGSQANGVRQNLGLPPANTPGNVWLTALEDTASPRQGTDDVYFAPAPDQSRDVPAPNIVFTSDSRQPLPLDIVCAALVVLVFGVRVSYRRLSRHTAEAV